MLEPLGPNGAPALDVAGRPKCGLTILDRSEETGPGSFHAEITDPDDGKVWNCILSVAADGHLHLRGYVLVPLLGKTQVWTRYQGQIGTGCAIG